MPTVVKSIDSLESLSIHRFSIKEYHRLIEAGIFHEDDRVELIEGRIVDMTPIGSRHAACVDRIVEIFTERFKRRVIVRSQNPIYLNEESEPEPDVTILKRREDFYAEGHPTPSDVLSIIEVVDTSLEYDRSVKVPLYAKAGINEVWLINLIDNVIEEYREPSPEGYGLIIRRWQNQTISPQSFPDIELSVSEILGI